MKKTIFLLAICAILAGCATSYHVHIFSDNVQALNSTVVETITEYGRVRIRVITEGEFQASTLEEAMRAAHEAGFTRILSIEYGTNHILWIFGTRWVRIRSAREEIFENIQN